ncbi:amidase [Saccharopolyspora sp. 6V]|uniref:amidase n=1 Tax=Saccharopolyspora sp. 6V TaxID=2877239 RepID=UPI001CD3578A|nr:amidase [Saccharopolyspora sp. 6V]MCA1192873.1 amidase [Saccharopolyspora sp. 6V]
MSDELYWKTAMEIGELYRRREVSPVEVVDAILDRMDHVDPLLNVIVTRAGDEARAQAHKAERRLRSGEHLPPLFGIPVTVKDLVETAGVRTTYGCTAFAEFVPDDDAIGWARLKQQGAILLGKTTTPEFGLLGVTESKLTGSTSTPWRPGYTAGGSSGGAAAAVASGVGPVAWGTDGGGSIRVPASLCGAVGIKPSIGRIPTVDNTDGDATEGPIARTVLDAALVFEATHGHHPADRFSIPRDTRSYVEAACTPGDLTGIRVAACSDLGQSVLDPEVRAAFIQALEDMRSDGAVVEEVSVTLPDTAQFFERINGFDYLELVEQMHANGVELWPMCHDLARRAEGVTGKEVNWAFREGKTEIYNAFATAMAGADVLVTPTTPVSAFPHGGDRGPIRLVDGQEVPPLGILIHSMTEPPSHAGLPALNLPCGFDSEGLPIGLQFVGHLWADADVISIAARYERITTWHARRPAL